MIVQGFSSNLAGSSNVGGSTEPRRKYPQGSTENEAVETGSWRGAAWSKRDLRSRSRAARQKEQGRAVEDGGSGRLCYQAIQYQKRRGIIGIQNSDVSQCKGGRWGESRDTAGDREIFRKQLTVGQE